mmetsp:Transcript_33465/g.92678  ORF Transcript_33465/g.92678 Transcript_33465/m.92678 type:complete len:200 (+) Transcript_33465:931-1530(+)
MAVRMGWYVVHAGPHCLEEAKAVCVIRLQDVLLIPSVPRGHEEQVLYQVPPGICGHVCEGALKPHLEVARPHMVLVPSIATSGTPVEARVGAPVLHVLLHIGQVLNCGCGPPACFEELPLLAATTQEVEGRIELTAPCPSLVLEWVAATHCGDDVKPREAAHAGQAAPEPQHWVELVAHMPDVVDCKRGLAIDSHIPGM